MSVVTWIHEFNAAPAGALPRNVFRYVLGTSGLHQLFLLALTVSVFLLEVVPLELQRRIVNNLVKHRPFSWVVSLCAVYAGIVLVQGTADRGGRASSSVSSRSAVRIAESGDSQYGNGLCQSHLRCAPRD
jgi:hypothetical protein